MGAVEINGSHPSRSLSDARLTALVALALFVLSAWPLLLVDLPPFQDLPNHVATAHIIAHLDLFPQYGFNGLFKSNALLTLWFHLVGGHGLFGAARAFVAIVLAVNAIAIPVFVLRFAGRRHLLVAMLIAWPSGSQLLRDDGFPQFRVRVRPVAAPADGADRQRERPTLPRGAGIAALSCLLWYAHPFPLMVVGALCGLHAATQRLLACARRRRRRVAVAARARGAAVARGGAAAPGQGRARHDRGRRHLLLPEPVGDRRAPLDRRLRRAHALGQHDDRPGAAVAVVRLAATARAGPVLLAAGDGDPRRRLRRPAGDDEQLVAPQLPARSVLVGGPPAAARRRRCPGRSRSRSGRAALPVLRRHRRRPPCVWTATGRSSPPASTPCRRAPRCCR